MNFPKLGASKLSLRITAGAQGMTREPRDLRVPGSGSWESRTLRPRPPPRGETQRERVQARLPGTWSSQPPAQRRLPPRPSYPRLRKGNRRSGGRVRGARWDSATARGRPQLPTSQSFLWPRPPSLDSRGRRGLSSPGAQSRGSGARGSELGSRPPGAPVTGAQVTGVVPPTPQQPTRTRPPRSSLRRGSRPGPASGHGALVPGPLP